MQKGGGVSQTLRTIGKMSLMAERDSKGQADCHSDKGKVLIKIKT